MSPQFDGSFSEARPICVAIVEGVALTQVPRQGSQVRPKCTMPIIRSASGYGTWVVFSGATQCIGGYPGTVAPF